MGGSYPEDVSVDGVFDLAGNVAEWTSSTFEPHPGFRTLEIKRRGQRKKTRVSAEFDSEKRVYRGGSYFGNEVTNNVVYRAGQHPSSAAEAIGFRCVKSARPGYDSLQAAATTGLALMRSDIKGRLDWSEGTMAAQEITTTDSESGEVIQYDVLAYTHIHRTTKSESKFMKDTIEEPELIGILVTSKPILDPALPAGSYALYFRGKARAKLRRSSRRSAAPARPTRTRRRRTRRRAAPRAARRRTRRTRRRTRRRPRARRRS